ncbi:hypothetical protein CBS101457_001871 [Exobasidium rhododendri]|nr:hypothetical protein CBS101457_001871 [Exobasidium rhododendri]
MSRKVTASGGSGVGPNRRKWDIEEYSEKARERDREDKERAVENEERIRKGQKPLHSQQIKKRKEDLPIPTESLKARENDLEIAKNQGKTLMVDNAQSGGRKGPGFYCETCNRTYKDSIAYLDHVNGRQHLKQLGQTTQVARSTVEEVRSRLEYWQEEMKQRSKTETRQYDFEARLAEIADQQRAEKQQRRAKRREAKQPKTAPVVDAEAMAIMGFGGFGASKKK